MTNLDLFWKSNKDWFTRDGFKCVIKEDAPQEAKDSYYRYLKQCEEAEKRGSI